MNEVLRTEEILLFCLLEQAAQRTTLFGNDQILPHFFLVWLVLDSVLHLLVHSPELNSGTKSHCQWNVVAPRECHFFHWHVKRKQRLIWEICSRRAESLLNNYKWINIPRIKPDKYYVKTTLDEAKSYCLGETKFEAHRMHESVMWHLCNCHLLYTAEVWQEGLVGVHCQSGVQNPTGEHWQQGATDGYVNTCDTWHHSSNRHHCWHNPRSVCSQSLMSLTLLYSNVPTMLLKATGSFAFCSMHFFRLTETTKYNIACNMLLVCC